MSLFMRRCYACDYYITEQHCCTFYALDKLDICLFISFTKALNMAQGLVKLTAGEDISFRSIP